MKNDDNGETSASASISSSVKHTNKATNEQYTIEIALPIKIVVYVDCPKVVTKSVPTEAEFFNQISPYSGAKPLVGSVQIIDPDYKNRTGYNEHFLGAEFEVPYPSLGTKYKSKIAPLLNNNTEGMLKYEHFSIVMHKDRRLAIFTAANIDGTTHIAFDREGQRDKWYVDNRMDSAFQTGDEAYAELEIQQGHLVRRIDPSWGKTQKEAMRGNNDTFHWTNRSPQHRLFNTSENVWLGLEKYILTNAINHQKRVCLFTGPVLEKSDPEIDGTKVPLRFWKVAVITTVHDTFSATAYIVDQTEMIQTILADRAGRVRPYVESRDFHYGKFKNFQLPIHELEEILDIKFGNFREFDPLSISPYAIGSATHRPLEKVDDIRL